MLYSDPFLSIPIPCTRLRVALLMEHFNWENQCYQFCAVPVDFERNFPAQRKFLFKIKIALDMLITAVLIKDLSVARFFLQKL